MSAGPAAATAAAADVAPLGPDAGAAFKGAAGVCTGAPLALDPATREELPSLSEALCSIEVCVVVDAEDAATAPAEAEGAAAAAVDGGTAATACSPTGSSGDAGRVLAPSARPEVVKGFRNPADCTAAAAAGGDGSGNADDADAADTGAATEADSMSDDERRIDGAAAPAPTPILTAAAAD